jgi:hypothetical protein
MQLRIDVVLYTKHGCGLCEEMKVEMTQAGCDELYRLEEVDITTDPELFARYRYDIPVLLMNGVERFRHRLTAERFRAAVLEVASQARLRDA